jgi:hypothetical protein
VVIGGYYDELYNPNEFRYLTINVNAFTKTELTNKAVNKFFKKFTENELDALNKKGKVSIKAPKKSSYNPQAGFSGDVVLVNPFQKQTMMKLGTDLDLLRDKNVLLYDAFVNVINVLNKKIESKLPKAEKKETQELFGYSPMLYGFIKKQSDFESQLNSFKEGSTLDSFAFERLQESNQKEIKYFTNLDDLINYHAQIIDMIAIIICKSYRRGSLPSMKSTSLMAKLDNLPLFIQNLTVYFDYVEYQGTHMMRIYFMRSAYSNYLCSCFFPINDFLIEKFEEKTRIDFFANIIRMFLSTSYIQRLRFGKIFQFKDNDSWKKSLEMLKPYFYLDIEMLKTLNCFKIIYEINSVPDWELTRYPEWQVNPKFGNWYNETEEIRNEFNREISFNIYTRVESDNQIEAWKKYVGQYDQTTIDVFEGKLIPKTETETDDFLQELDSMDFGDESLFASEVVNELENLDFEDPDLFN